MSKLELGKPGPFLVLQLNNRGQALMLDGGTNGYSHTLLWDERTGSSRDLGIHYTGDVLNDRGQVIFNRIDRYNHGLPQPFIFEQGKAWILGHLGKRGASAWDINDHDQIVGDASGHAVIWTRR